MTKLEHVQNVQATIVANLGEGRLEDAQRGAVAEALMDIGIEADASRDACVELSRALLRWRKYCAMNFQR